MKNGSAIIQPFIIIIIIIIIGGGGGGGGSSSNSMNLIASVPVARLLVG